jgi:predicted peptidase
MIKFSVYHFIGFVSLCLLSYSCNINTMQLKEADKGVYLKKTFSIDNGVLNYRIFYPKGFDSSKAYPMLLFMHGAGERGDDNEAQLTHGSELIAKGMNDYNAIAIFPQCPQDDYWVKFKSESQEKDGARSFDIDVENGPSEALGKVIGLMDEMKEKDYINQSKVYVMGLSMGGMATFDLLWRMPNTFAAAMPICGAGSPEKANHMSSVPMRIFHGEEDSVVPISNSRVMQAAIESLGGSPETYYYPSVNHDSWTNAFAEKDFLSWMFEQEIVDN